MIVPGFMVLHSNRMEVLRDVLVQWLKQSSLQPLESEIILVQSHGMAQWVKHAMASADGMNITAGVEVSLPARFLWRMYRAVLAGQNIADTSPLDKESLVWRLLRHLPERLSEPAFRSLKQYLATEDESRRLYQLCQQVADVFDQYQVYRADWLDDWANGDDRLGDLPRMLTESQQQTLAWQSSLWRALLADIGKQAIASSRASVHPRVMEVLEKATQRPAALPRRVVVFGMSSLPAQTLEALSAMARFSQVILCVHNPCQFYWGDIVADKELLRHRTPRHQLRVGMPDSLSGEDLHQHAHPLLAAWGKLGRDYIALLEEHDNPSSYAKHFQKAQHPSSIDLFAEPPTDSLLGQLQSDILNLRPLHESRECWGNHEVKHDNSLQFHIAHGAQREVEILHDQLLACLEQDAELQPRDIIVMVPDIDSYAPHIQAVFGQTSVHDNRYIPYAIADQGERGREPLLIALELLLHLPELRLTTTQVLELLDIPALRQRFSIAPQDLPLLERWIMGAGARWGLNASQRHQFDLPQGLTQNTWEFGLQRMLLGYAMGGTETFAGHYPYDEVAGLEAAALGHFVQLINALEHTRGSLSRGYHPAEWAMVFHQLLEDFFEPVDTSDELLLLSLRQAIDRWLQACADADFNQPLELSISREAWLQGLAQHQDSRGFMAGTVTFCTLMPMRAIPFKMVCLLGMNDDAYPRSILAPDFDLMNDHYRPGDRSRREDDRYLFLEALMAARDTLIVSWVGRSQNDNSIQPPSVLVAQLRDHIEKVYGVSQEGSSPLEAITTHHPLQPFSARYFDGSSPKLFTYATEWLSVHTSSMADMDDSRVASWPETEHVHTTRDEQCALTVSCTIQDLEFFLRQPVVQFYRQQFRVDLKVEENIIIDDEPFEIDALQRYQLRRALLKQGQSAGPEYASQAIASALAQQKLAGRLPLPPFDARYADEYQEALSPQLQAYFETLEGMQPVDRALTISFNHEGTKLQDVLPPHWIDSQGQAYNVHLFVGDIKSRGDWKWYRIQPFWIQHVLFHVAEQPLTTYLVGQDRTLSIQPFDTQGEAIRQLQYWLDGWQIGMRQPLPIEHDTAADWLEGFQKKNQEDLQSQRRKALRNARGTYQSTGPYRNPALNKSSILKRDYPDFDTLISASVNGKDFYQLAEEFYGLLHRHPMNAPTKRPLRQAGSVS